MEKNELQDKLEHIVLEIETDSEGELSKAEQVIVYNLKTALKYVKKLED